MHDPLAIRPSTTVVEQIQQLILDERLHPGDSLPTEAVLVDRLEVSRSSVREAIRTLSSLDIVEVRHGRGTIVGRMSMAPLVNGLLFRTRLNGGDDLRTLREIVQVRIALDHVVADELIAAHRGIAHPELRALIERMRENATTGRSFAAEDSEFHAALLAPVDNELIKQLSQAFWDVHTAALPLLGIPKSEEFLETVDAHRGMLDALEVGDASAYKASIASHYGPLERSLARASG